MANEKAPLPRPPQYALKARRSSAGLGLFAGEDIPKGRFVVEYWGAIVDDREANRIGGKYLFELGKDRNILGADRRNVARYANHSCAPNAEARLVGGRRVLIFSVRKIKAGEEITYHYGPDYFSRLIRPQGCRCGRCRKTV